MELQPVGAARNCCLLFVSSQLPRQTLLVAFCALIGSCSNPAPVRRTCGILIVDGDGAIRVAMWDMSPTEIDMLDQPSKDTGKSAPGWRFLKLLGRTKRRAGQRQDAIEFVVHRRVVEISQIDLVRARQSPRLPLLPVHPSILRISLALFWRRPESRVSIATRGERLSRR
jgi:hypothetical protein